jgi:NAD(P)-dependent dehydrogenase (short-subunit alcohol dehydrogenase family)
MVYRTLFDLNGKTALITGGSGAIGSAVALGLAEFGARIAIADVNLQGAEKVAREVREQGGKALALEMNVAKEDSIKAAVNTCRADLGDIDILFNNAGIQDRRMAVDYPMEEWDRVIDINLRGIFLVARTVAAMSMLPRRRGKIINTTSQQAIRGRPGGSAYVASKSGVIALTRVLANEWAPQGLHVNAIAPSSLDTPMTAPVLADPARRQKALAGIPVGRFGTGADLVGTVVYLASAASDFMVGQTLFVEGGRSLM